jgi:Tfp pilus assembly protein PilZ
MVSEKDNETQKNFSVKKHKSRFLYTIAWCYILFPILYMVTSGVLYEIHFSKVFSILLSPLFYFVSVWAILGGIGLSEMTQWSWYVFVFSNILIFYQNALIAADYSDSPHRFMLFGVSTVLTLILSWRVKTEIHVPYIIPKIRWWESDPTRQFRVTTDILSLASGQKFKGTIMDMQTSGCFVKTHENFLQDEKLELSFNLLGHDVVCKGSVVWRAPTRVIHPKGVGVIFEFEKDKKSLRKLKLGLAGRRSKKDFKKVLV